MVIIKDYMPIDCNKVLKLSPVSSFLKIELSVLRQVCLLFMTYGLCNKAQP